MQEGARQLAGCPSWRGGRRLAPGKPYGKSPVRLAYCRGSISPSSQSRRPVARQSGPEPLAPVSSGNDAQSRFHAIVESMEAGFETSWQSLSTTTPLRRVVGEGDDLI